MFLKHKKSANASATRRQVLLGGALLLSAALPVMARPLPAVKVWKDPNCGCCKEWVNHMKQAGFSVEVFETGNAQARARLGIPAKYGSCHTSEVGGYAIEGHVPAADVKRLLKEAPKAIGLAAPGMPVGSPGMDGPDFDGQKDPYDVLLIMADGGSKVFQSHR
jgi:hypothetical protein